MSSGAGEAEDLGEVAPPISDHTVQKEEDTVGAIYSEQARIEMGSTTVGDAAADRARIYVAKKKEEMITISELYCLTESALMMLLKTTTQDQCQCRTLLVA